MPSFRDSPIRRKLMLLSVLTSSVTLFFACAAFVSYELVTYRESTLQRISSQAEIVAYNIASALLFDVFERAQSFACIWAFALHESPARFGAGENSCQRLS